MSNISFKGLDKMAADAGKAVATIGAGTIATGGTGAITAAAAAAAPVVAGAAIGAAAGVVIGTGLVAAGYGVCKVAKWLTE